MFTVAALRSAGSTECDFSDMFIKGMSRGGGGGGGGTEGGGGGKDAF